MQAQDHNTWEIYCIYCIYLKTAEFLDLVLYERSEWGHHYSHPTAHEGWQLVAQALPSACRHENETVVTEERRVDRFQLLQSEPLHTKYLCVCVCVCVMEGSE